MKTYKVKWTTSAVFDLHQIIQYISSQNPLSAKKIFQGIKIRAKNLQKNPRRGRFVPELKAHSILNYQEIFYKPWRIIYRIDEEKVFIFAVIDGRRDLEDILLERLIH